MNISFLESEKQIILVKVYKEKTILQMKEKNKDNEWVNLLETQAFIGENGIGKQKEGDKKSPKGLYDLGIAFGIKDNPRNDITIY